MNKKLYVLGLILTDGYKYKNHYRIELKDEDKNVLEDIANNYNCSLYHRTRDTNFTKNFGSTTLEIKDKDLISFLDKYYPIENKTYSATIPEEYLFSPSLWRGILDGDGSYGYRGKTPFISFVTINENFKESFCKVIKEIIGQELMASRNQRDNVYNLCLTSVKAKKFIEWLLSETSFSICRKEQSMKEIIQWQPTGKQGEIHKRWTKEEEDYVYTHTNQECVEKLGRTLSSIKNRRTKINKERKIIQ